MDVIVSGATGTTDRKLKEALKTRCAAVWNASLRSWLVPDSQRANVLTLIDSFAGVTRTDARPTNKNKAGHFGVIFTKTDAVPSPSSSSSSSSSSATASTFQSLSTSSSYKPIVATSLSLSSSFSSSSSSSKPKSPSRNGGGGGGGSAEILEGEMSEEEGEEEKKGNAWRFVSAGLSGLSEPEIRRLVDFHHVLYDYVRNYVLNLGAGLRYGPTTDLSFILDALENEDVMPKNARVFLMSWFPGGPAAIAAAKKAREATQAAREKAELETQEVASQARKARYAQAAAEKKKLDDERKAREEALDLTPEEKERLRREKMTPQQRRQEDEARLKEEAERLELEDREAQLRALQKRRAEEAEEETKELRKVRRRKNVVEKAEEEAIALVEREEAAEIARELETKRVKAERIAARYALRELNLPQTQAYKEAWAKTPGRLPPTHHAYKHYARLQNEKRAAAERKAEAVIVAREAEIAADRALIAAGHLPERRLQRIRTRITANIAANRAVPCANSRLRPDMDDETGDIAEFELGGSRGMSASGEDKVKEEKKRGAGGDGKEEKKRSDGGKGKGEEKKRENGGKGGGDNGGGGGGSETSHVVVVVRPRPLATGDVGKTIRLTIKAKDGVEYHVCYDVIKLRMWLRHVYGQYSSRSSWFDPTFDVRFTPEQSRDIERRMHNMDKCDVVVPQPLSWHPSDDGHTVALPRELFTAAVFREKRKKEGAILNYRLSSPGFAHYAYVTVTEGHAGDSKTIQLPPDVVEKLHLKPDSKIRYESCFALPRIAALALRPNNASWEAVATPENKDALTTLLERAIGAKFITTLGDVVHINFHGHTHLLTVVKIQGELAGAINPPRIDAGISEGTVVQLEIWPLR